MKYLSIIRYVLILVSVLVVVVPFIQGGGSSNIDVDTMLRWTYILVAATVVTIIVLPIFNIAKNPKASVRSLIGLLIVGVAFALAYSLSSSEPIEATATKIYNDPLELKLSDTGLFMSYVAFGLAMISILFGEVYKLFK